MQPIGSYTWPELSQDFMLQLLGAMTPDGFMPSDEDSTRRFWQVVLSGPRGSDNFGRAIVVCGINGPRPVCCLEAYAQAALERAGGAAAPVDMPVLRAWCIARAEARQADTRGKSSLRLRRRAGSLRGKAKGAELEAIRWATARLMGDAGRIDALSLYQEARRAVLAAAAA